MITLRNDREELKSILEEIINLLRDITSGIERKEKNRIIYANTPVITDKNELYLVTEGILLYQYKGKSIRYINEGEIVGIENILDKEGFNAIPAGGAAVKVDVFDINKFNEIVENDKEKKILWRVYLKLAILFERIICENYAEEVFVIEPKVEMYNKGDVIIKEGDTDNSIYFMVQGSASVYVKDHKIGVIYENEIFGEIASLTGTPRTATIIANESCMVTILPGNNLSGLMKSRPDLMEIMIYSLAKRLASTNLAVKD